MQFVLFSNQYVLHHNDVIVITYCIIQFILYYISYVCFSLVMSHLSPQHVQFEDGSDEDRDVCVHVNTSLCSPDIEEDIDELHSVITTDNGEHSLVVGNGYPSSSTPDMEEQSQEEVGQVLKGYVVQF